MLGTTREPTVPLVGRVDEQRLLASLLDEVDARGQALVLRGEPGIGKSRLLAEAAQEARARGMAVLTAAGVQSEAQLPFAGLHQLLRPVRERAINLAPIQRQALDAAFGLTDEAAPEPYRIAMAALDIVSEAAAERPVLLAVDDAHWLDRPTAEVLAFVARRIECDPVLLLAGVRDGYPGGLADSGLPEHRLTGLDDSSAAALLDAAAPDLPLTVRSRLLREAAGNPLALLELPGARSPDTAEQSLRGGLPLTERLERAFAGRVSDLPDITRLTLIVAALSDGDAVGEILGAASAVAGSSVDLDVLEPAVGAALVDLDVNSIHFRHPLIRSAVRQSASVQQRRRAHEALAATLEAAPDRRVWHRAALITGTQEELAQELEEAGVRAQRRGAIDVALTALGRAVQLSAPNHRAGRMFATAELAFERGRPDIAIAMLREIEHLNLSRLEMARARWVSELLDARALIDDSRVTELIAIAEDAGAAGERDLYHNLLWIAAARTWWASPGPDTRQLIVDAANRAGPPTAADPRLVSIHAYAHPYVNASNVVGCLREAAVTSAEDAGFLTSAGMVVGAFHDCLRFCAIAIDRARADGRLGRLPRLLATQAIVAVRLPNWDIAIPAAEEARRLATELRQPIWLATAETAVAMIAALRGEAVATELATARAEQIALPLGASHIVALAQSGPTLSALAHGSHAEALRLADRLFDPLDSAHHLHFACMGIGDLAEAAAYSGNSQVARERLGEAEAMVGSAPAEWVAISLRHARALLAHDEAEAAVHFEDALRADLDSWPFWRGRLLLAYGRWLRRRRRIADSRAPLREAREVFDAIGASIWADQARRELRASGERSRRRVPEARDDLTAQELQIAQLAAEGLSNREIGQRLFLSHRTISTHLYRVFPKLGITSRSELSAALASGAEPR